jgi:crotonobetaine/carnitine-CoA ligase
VTTFHELLRNGAADHGDRTAIRFEDASVSYEALLDRVEQVAGGLSALGVSAADHVALVMDNSLECVWAWLASSVIGCTEVPINPQYRGDLLAYLLSDSETSVIVCDAHYLAQVTEIAAKLPLLRMILVSGDTTVTNAGAVPVLGFDWSVSGEPIAVNDDAPERVILYTSGTTGPSKGVVHTQKSMLTLSRYNAEMLEYGPEDRLLNFFPLYHQNARYTGVIPALCAGASIRIQKRLSTSTFWQTCAEDGVTAFNYLGSVLRLILNVTPPDLTAEGHTIRKAFGAGAPPPIWQDLEARLGIRLVEVYGLSEAPMATVNVRKGAQGSQIGSAGRASDLFEIAIVDADDQVLPPGGIGEIVLRPKRPDAMMLGYYGKDAATVRAWRNLWFHSGDRGRLSEAGDLFFEEREKDSIRRRGENISAWEVEGVLDMHPDVAESAVYGIADADADEEVAAALVLIDPDADLAAILRFAAERLPRYAVPSLLRVMKDLPRTPTEKVQKAELRKTARAEHLAATDILAADAA